MNIEPKFNYHSLRAQKARFSVKFGNTWHVFTVILSGVLVLLGIWSIIEHGAIGWLLTGVSGPFIMLAIWWQKDLKTAEISKNPQTIDDVMAADVLGRMPVSPTPKDIVAAIAVSRAGQFLAVRLGVTPNFLNNIASADAMQTADIWRSAIKIWQETNSPKITGAVLAVAVIEQFPNHDALLANMKIDINDVKEGVRWYERIKFLIEQYKIKPLRTGGLARDWSFGYTPLLSRFAQNISLQVSGGALITKLEAHQAVLDQMIKTFNSGGRQNITLVGADGAGKSTVVSAFAEMLIDGLQGVPQKLLYQQIFMLDASSLISQASGRGQLENLVTAILNEAYLSKNVILFLDNAQLFFEEGVGSVDLSNQDTGIVCIFMEIGQNVHFIGGNLEDAINEGVVTFGADY